MVEKLTQDGAFDFDGGHLDIGDLNLGSEVTLQAWVNLDGNDGLATMSRIFDLGNGTGSDNIIFSFDNDKATRSLTTFVFNGSSSTYLQASTSVPDTGWHHLSTTIASDGLTKIYIDGVVVASGTLNVPTDTTLTSNLIGKSNWAGDPVFDGLMGDVRIWSRALTDNEIADSLQTQPSGSESDLVAYIPLHEGSTDNAVNAGVAVTEVGDVGFKAPIGYWEPKDERTFVVENPGVFDTYRVFIPEDQSSENYVGFDEISMHGYDVSYANSNATPESIFVADNSLPLEEAFDAIRLDVLPNQTGTVRLSELQLVADQLLEVETLSTTDFDHLNIDNVDGDLFAGYQQRIVARADDEFTTGTDLQAVINEVNSNTAAIFSYLADSNSPAVTEETFALAGLRGVTADNLSFVIKALESLDGAQSSAALQAGIDTYIRAFDLTNDYIAGRIDHLSDEDLAALQIDGFDINVSNALRTHLVALNVEQTPQAFDALYALAEADYQAALARISEIATLTTP
ncbi:MAG: LamG domain-containing protein, partial [Marivivens sp.]|nr:LamG domain-containing protein [Marivivens sp.]